MASRTSGKISIHRDHPNPETAASLVYLRADERAHQDDDIAVIYGAKAGTEKEANAQFFVRAWNSHDELVAALNACIPFVAECRFESELVRAALNAAGAA